MKNTVFTLLLLSLVSAPALQAGTVTLTIVSDASAAPGSQFNWEFTIDNESGYVLAGIDSVQSTFPVLDGIAADNPAVTGNFDAFNALYFDYGLPSGDTSLLEPLAYYSIAANAPPGAQVGGGMTFYTLAVTYDLFTDNTFAEYVGTYSVISDHTAVVVTGGSVQLTPEPSSVGLFVGGLVLILAAQRKNIFHRNQF